jgi:hypothetical protein
MMVDETHEVVPNEAMIQNMIKDKRSLPEQYIREAENLFTSK